MDSEQCNYWGECTLPVGHDGPHKDEGVTSEQSTSPRGYVSDEYARAYEAGALAALEWLGENYPDLDEPTMAAAEYVGGVIDRMLGRRK